jgi:hypothetical protein
MTFAGKVSLAGVYTTNRQGGFHFLGRIGD